MARDWERPVGSTEATAASCPYLTDAIFMVNGWFSHNEEVERSGKQPFNVQVQALGAALCARSPGTPLAGAQSPSSCFGAFFDIQSKLAVSKNERM